jgi:hypothetical protein
MVQKVPINSGCAKSPNGRHTWENGRDDAGRIVTWCRYCHNLPK